MTKSRNALAALQVSQMVFETTLSGGRFYNADNREAARQYGNLLAIFGNDQLAQTTLPRALIATLAMANRLNINLGHLLDQDIAKFRPSKFESLRALTAAFADHAGLTPRDINLHDRIGSNMASASGDIASINIEAEPIHLRALDPEFKVTQEFNARAELEGVVLFAAQDILTVAGMLESIDPEKDLTKMELSRFPALESLRGMDKKYDLLTETKGVWNELTEMSKPAWEL